MEDEGTGRLIPLLDGFPARWVRATEVAYKNEKNEGR
jgi:hypothetical protein